MTTAHVEPHPPAESDADLRVSIVLPAELRQRVEARAMPMERLPATIRRLLHLATIPAGSPS